MRVFAILSVCVTLVGCYQPDQRVVGRFRAQAGEVVDIRSDGRIIFVIEGREERVGLVTIDHEEPLSIRVIAPDTSPLIGTEIVFSSDRQSIDVAWQDYRKTNGTRKRPVHFQKE